LHQFHADEISNREELTASVAPQLLSPKSGQHSFFDKDKTK
jgi:hypothetical protein